MTTETLPRTAPAEPTTPIKPSEAIRLGCLIAPVQGEGRFFGPEPGMACALGAMALGFGYNGPTDLTAPQYWDFVIERLPDALPGLYGADAGFRDAVDAIYVRNDNHWSRERIADWLEGLGL